MDYNIQYKAALLEISFESEESDDLNLIIHSSSSDDEDEIVKNLYTVLDKNRKKLNKKPQIEGFVEKVIPGYTAKEFKTHFRYIIFMLTANINCLIFIVIVKILANYDSFVNICNRLLPTTFDFILRLIGPSLNSTRSVAGRKPISAQKQLLMALWMMATPDSYRYYNGYAWFFL